MLVLVKNKNTIDNFKDIFIYNTYGIFCRVEIH